MQGVGFEPTMLYAYPLKGYVLTNSTILAYRDICPQIFIVLYV